MPEPTDPQILEHVLGGSRGDEPAASALVRTLDPLIRVRALKVFLRFARGAGIRNAAQQVDVLARHVWARLRHEHWRILRRWTPACGVEPLAWLGLMTERQLIEALRSQEPPIEGPLSRDEDIVAPPPGCPVPEVELGSRDALRRVVHALRAELSARGAAIFELLIIEEQPVEHVCTVMEMTKDAVFQWRSRIARRARDIAMLFLEEADRPRTT